MDPASSLLVGHAASKLLDKLSSSFRTHVIERWSRRRAEAFFAQFCDEVSRRRGDASLRELEEDLTKLVEDEVCSEVLFDAYRRVSLTKSRLLGPRIIGLLTAQLVVEGRAASEVEDAIFGAAEGLTDEEFIAFAAFVREERAKSATSADDAAGGLKIKWYQEEIDIGFQRRESVSTAPLDLDDCLGRWAVKMKSYGIIKDDVHEREFRYSPDAESDSMDEGTVREVTWWIYVSADYFKLVELIESARRSEDNAA